MILQPSQWYFYRLHLQSHSHFVYCVLFFEPWWVGRQEPWAWVSFLLKHLCCHETLSDRWEAGSRGPLEVTRSTFTIVISSPKIHWHFPMNMFVPTSLSRKRLNILSPLSLSRSPRDSLEANWAFLFCCLWEPLRLPELPLKTHQ